jgi:addiction module HigA family antidote
MAGDAPGFRPIHPGVVVKRNIDALGMTIEAFADHIGTSRQNAHAIIRGARAVTPEMAVRLGRAFKTSSRFWLDMQANHDLWEPERKASISRIRPITAGQANRHGRHRHTTGAANRRAAAK